MYTFEIPSRRKNEENYFIIRSTRPFCKEYFEISQHYRYKNQNKITEEKDKEKDVINYLRTIKNIDNFEDLLEKIECLQKLKCITQYYVFYDGKTLYIFYSFSVGKDICLLAKYRDKNEYVFKYFVEKVLSMSTTNKFIHFEGNHFNNFSFFTSSYILRIILKKAEIESKNEELFIKFKKTSKNGKIREIIAPHEEIKKELRNLNSLLQKIYDCRNKDFQIAYKKKKSVKDGAKIHTENKYVYNIDLTDFYPSCKRNLVKRYTDFLFSFTGNRTFVENEFFSVILMDDGLFIGSPISGVLANTIISGPISYLKNICSKYDISLSVYADDISFSSNKFISKDFVVKIFNEAFTKYKLEEYFKLNEKKCKGFSGMHRKITGVSINESNEITIPRRYFRELRSQIAHLANGDNINVNQLRGKIAYALMIDESGKVSNYLNKFKDISEQFNLCKKEVLS